jgi:hypothetical protein
VAEGRTTKFEDCVEQFVQEANTDSTNQQSIISSDGTLTNIPWQDDIARDGTTVTGSRCHGVHSRYYPEKDDIDYVKEVMKIQDALKTITAVKTFAFNDDYIDLERTAGYVPAATTSLIGSIVAVLGITLVFLVSPLATGMVGLMIVMVDVWLLGMMALWDVRLSEVSLVAIVQAIGFAAGR